MKNPVKIINIIQLCQTISCGYSEASYSEASNLKVFLYSCDPMNKTDAQIMLEAELYYDYLKKYKPVNIIKKIEQADPFDLDKYVKQYMICFGCKNVRGGSYIDEILPQFQEDALIREFETAAYDKLQHMDEVYSISNNYTNHFSCSVSDISQIQKKKALLNYNMQTYLTEKRALADLQIETDVLEDVLWLKTIVLSYHTKIPSISQEDKAKYRCLVVSLKHIYTIYTQILAKLPHCKFCENYPTCNSPCNIFIKYPELLLDDFFFHFNRTHLATSVQSGEHLCNMYEYFINTIINKMQEKQFDVSSWDSAIEWTTPRKIYLLDKIAQSFM